MAQDTPSRDLDKIIVRLPDGMRDKLKNAALSNNRSVNAEVVARLEESFASQNALAMKPDTLKALVDEVQALRGQVSEQTNYLARLSDNEPTNALARPRKKP